jgi:hypothetical protein
MNNLNSQITTDSTQLKSIPNLNTVLTVQNAVNALPSLYAQRPIATRLPTYLSQVTPSTVTISSLTINFTTNAIDFTGQATNLAAINIFVDTLKDCNYQATSNSSSVSAFTDVALGSYGLGNQTGSTGTSGSSQSTAVTYAITASFDPSLFDQSSTSTTLNIPGNSYTRTSSSDSALFQASPSSSTSTTNTTSTQ